MRTIFDQDIPDQLREDLSRYFRKISETLYKLKESEKTSYYILSKYGNNIHKYLDIVKEEIYDKVIDYIMRKTLEVYEKENSYEKVIDFVKNLNVKKFFFIFIKRFLTNIVKNMNIDFMVYSGDDESYSEALERIYYANSEVEIEESSYYETENKEDRIDSNDIGNEVLKYYYEQIINTVKEKTESYYEIANNSAEYFFSLDMSEISNKSFSDKVGYVLDKYQNFVFDNTTSFGEYILKVYCLIKLIYEAELHNIYNTTRVKKVKKNKVFDLSSSTSKVYRDEISNIILLLHLYLDEAQKVIKNNANENIKILMLQILYFVVATDGYLLYNNVSMLLNDFIRYSFMYGCVENPKTKPNDFIISFDESKCKLIDTRITMSIITSVIVKFRTFLHYSLNNNSILDNIKVNYKIRDKSNYKRMFENMMLFYIYMNFDILKNKTGAKHYNLQDTVRNSYNLTYKSTIFEILRRYRQNKNVNIFYFINNNILEHKPTLDIRKIRVKKVKNQ